MATISNRSRLVVCVSTKPQFTRTFPHNRKSDARAYRRALKAQGHLAVITQREDTLLIRIRQKGQKSQTLRANSYEEADTIIASISAERSTGLYRDYTQSRKTTLAKLIERYIREECPKHKGGPIETLTLTTMVEDSQGTLARLHRDRAAAIAAFVKAPVIKARRQPREALEWLQKPFVEVMAGDIEAFIKTRLIQVKPATVDRELDVLAQVINIAINTWGYDVNRNPLNGVRRPKFYNRRSRRLRGDEAARMFAAAREEDHKRSRRAAIEARLAAARREATTLPNLTAQKRHVAAARKTVIEALGDSYPVVPLIETLLTFQLETVARRGESLALTWDAVDLVYREAFFPDTKNNEPRTIPLRRGIASMLGSLPRTHKQVFPITVNALKGAWGRIRKAAGLGNLRIHDLRHEGISSMVEAGHRSNQPFDLMEISSVSGHKDFSMLSRYTHLRARNLADRLDEAFAEEPRSPNRQPPDRNREGTPRSLSLTSPAITEDSAKRVCDERENEAGAAARRSTKPILRLVKP